jgi:hypothetical protein
MHPETPILVDGSTTLYEYPTDGRSYLVTVDTSEGIGKDYHVAMVHDVTEEPFRQVAVYRNNEISTMVLPTVIKNLAQRFNDAYIMIEINNMGQQVSDILFHDLGYENMLTTLNTAGGNGQHINYKYSKNQYRGVKMTSSTKRIGCDNLKTLIENNKYILRDKTTIKELTTFAARKNTYMAEEGKNDDTVMCLVIFAWVSAQQYFRDMMDTDIRKIMEESKIRAEKEEELPFAIKQEEVYYNPWNMNMEKSTVMDGDRWFPVE